MDIKVLRKNKGIFVKQNTVEIHFKKFNWKIGSRKIPTIVAYDEQGDFIPVSLNLIHISSRIPSTLLSRWINANCSEKLLTLKDVCNTVERVKDGVNKGWWFTQKDNSIYGTHKHKVSESGNTFRVVTIEDGIGMQSVLNILKELQIEVECVYNKETQKMEKILITGEGL